MEALLFITLSLVGLVVLGKLLNNKTLLTQGLLGLLYLARLFFFAPVVIVGIIWALFKLGVYDWIFSHIPSAGEPVDLIIAALVIGFTSGPVYLVISSYIDAMMERLDKRHGFK